MKRILGIIFLLFFGICGTVGGVALFSGCSQSQTETGGGGTSSPSEDETEGQGCNYDFTVKNYVYTSTSGYAATASSTSSSTGAKASFSIYWLDNGKAVDWGNIPTTAGGYYAISNGSSNWSSGKVSSSSQTYAGPLSYFDYTFTDGNWFWYPDRYARIIPGYYKINTGATDTYVYPNGYAFFGVNTSSSGGTSSPIHSDYYIYGDGKVTTSESTANSGEYENLTGTFYAIWRKQYLLGYNANEGKGGPGAQYMYAGLSTKLSSTKPTRDGYTFAGWSTSKTATSATWSAGATLSASYVNKNLTLYAVWTPKQYSIRIYAMTGISDITQPATAWYSNSIGRYKEVTANYDSSYTIAVTTQTGYSFNRWTKSNSSTASAVSTSTSYTFTVGTSNTFYAWGKANSYTVSFNGNGGSSSQTSKSVTYQSTYGDLPTATRGGYSFAGWWTSSSGGNQVTSSTTVTTAGNHTLYAHWTKNVYKVDINILSPSGEQDNKSGTMDIRYSYSGNSFTGMTDQLEDQQVDYQGTITISNINPVTGYYVSSVTCTSGTLSSSNRTYTYTATMTGTPSGSWDDTIVIQMAWKEFPININILSPSGVEDSASGTMDLRYSDGVTANDVNNENVVDGTSKKLRYGGTIVISDIKPAEGYNLKSVTCDKGTLTDNGDGSYTYTCDFGNEANGTGALITIQMTYLFYDEDEGYYYIEDGEYPQSYAAVEWDEYSGDGVYGGARITYNKTSNILTLDGTMTSGTGTILRTRGISFKSEQVYTIWREYIGGNVSIQNNTGTSFVIDTIVRNSDNTPSTRNNSDAGVDSRGSSNLTINSASQNEADGFKFWIWLNTGTTVTFDNYQIRVYICYDNLLVNWPKSEFGTIPNPINNDQKIPVYSVNTQIADAPAGTKFVQVNNRWFKVEPIRWRVADFAIDLDIRGDGGWETIGQTINVRANTEYTIELNYSTPGFTPLSGYLGLALMVLTSSPIDSDCESIMIDKYQMKPNSKGTATISFNSGNNTQLYVILNFGYVNDGTSYSFQFGNLRISDKSVKIEKDISKWTRYRYGERFSISETDVVANNGVMTNFAAVSDKVLTIGAVVDDLSAVKEGWTYMKSGNLVSIYSSDYSVTGNNLTISYKASEQSYTLTNKSSSDPFATINQTVSLTKGVKYRMYMDVTNTSGAVVGANKVQVFYAINGSYNETNSRRFGDGTWKEFTAPATGIYKIRFDNDYGNTIIIKNFQVEVVSNNEASDLSQNISQAYETFKGKFSNTVGGFIDIDIYGYAGQQEKVLTAKAYSEGMRVASIEEMSYLVDKRAKASDMVCFLLGKNSNNTVNYWTRNLGGSLGNGQIITSAGTEKSNWLNKVNGVRLALTMGNGSRI